MPAQIGPDVIDRSSKRMHQQKRRNKGWRKTKNKKPLTLRIYAAFNNINAIIRWSQYTHPTRAFFKKYEVVDNVPPSYSIPNI